MIEIKYNNNTISISGHAEYASHGNDIVCAGVSTAFFYTCELLTRLNSKVEITSKNDLYKIEFKTLNENEKVIFETFKAILKEMEHNYNKNIKMSEVK